MDLLPLYKAIIEAIGLKANDEGYIFMELGDQLIPCTVNSERHLVLPTQAILREGVGDSRMAFHPIAESVVRGESAVLKKLRVLVNFRLGFVISELLEQLMGIATNKDYHHKLTPTQAEFLALLPEADAGVYKALDKVLDSTSATGANKLISVYLKRGGKIKNESYKRLAVVGFPLADELEKEERDIFGVKMRVKDKASIKALFEYILPNAGLIEEYSAGSNGHTAPYFDALIHAFIKVARRLNGVVHKFRKHLHNADMLKSNLDFEDDLADLSKYRDLIPVLDGNAGELLDEAGQEAPAPAANTNHLAAKAAQALGHNTAQKPAPAPAPAPQQPAPQQPQIGQQQAPRQADTGGGLDWNDVVNNQQRRMQQPPQQAFNPQQGNWPNQFPQQAPQVGPGGYAGYNRGVPQQQYDQWGRPIMQQNGFPQQGFNQMGQWPQQQPMGQQWPQQGQQPFNNGLYQSGL